MWPSGGCAWTWLQTLFGCWDDSQINWDYHTLQFSHWTPENAHSVLIVLLNWFCWSTVTQFHVCKKNTNGNETHTAFTAHSGAFGCFVYRGYKRLKCSVVWLQNNFVVWVYLIMCTCRDCLCRWLCPLSCVGNVLCTCACARDETLGSSSVTQKLISGR